MYNIISYEVKKEVETILKGAFQQGLEGQKDYKVIYSPTVCEMKGCTDGNHITLKNDKDQRFRRFIDTRKFVVYWAFPVGDIVNTEPTYSEEVMKARAYFSSYNGTDKMYIKNGRKHPIFPAHSCARSDNKIRQIEALEIGESTTNSSPTKITRVF